MISGCTNKEVTKHDYTYKGENEFWSAEYKVNGTVTFIEKDGKVNYESNANRTLIVTYKKELAELSSVKHLEISYDRGGVGGALSMDFSEQSQPTEKTYVLNSSGTGSEFLYEKEIVKVNISIDGEIQAIELKKL